MGNELALLQASRRMSSFIQSGEPSSYVFSLPAFDETRFQQGGDFAAGQTVSGQTKTFLELLGNNTAIPTQSDKWTYQRIDTSTDSSGNSALEQYVLCKQQHSI